MVLMSSVADFYSPFDKGNLMALAVGLFPFFGLVNGFIAARLYTFFNGSNWLWLAIVAATFLPFTIGGCIVLVDFLEYFRYDV